MVRKKRRSERKRIHRSHIAFIVIVCVILIIVFSARTLIDKGTEKASVVLLNGNLSEFLDNSTKIVMQNLTFTVKNPSGEQVKCSLELTLINETYKNSTIIDLPVLEPHQEVDHEIVFEMPQGNTNLSLSPLC